jgi:hypothetical protein
MIISFITAFIDKNMIKIIEIQGKIILLILFGFYGVK